jgi:hypothetical protein
MENNFFKGNVGGAHEAPEKSILSVMRASIAEAPPRTKKVAAAVLAAGLSLSLFGIAKWSTSSAEELNQAGEAPAGTPETMIGDPYSPEPSEAEATEEPTMPDNSGTAESQGQTCESSITISFDGTDIEVNTKPSNDDNSWSAIRYLGMNTVTIEPSNSFDAEWLFDNGINFELYAMYPDPEVDEFNPDNPNHEFCGSYEVSGYTEYGTPILSSTAPELEEDPEQPTSAAPETESPETEEPSDPFVFETQDFNGNLHNCVTDGETVEVFSNGGQPPEGYVVAVSAIEYGRINGQPRTLEYIAFVENDGKVELPQNEGMDYMETTAVLVPEGTIPGFQDPAVSGNRLQDIYRDQLESGELDFESLYPWQEEDVSYYPKPGGICEA